MRPSRFSAAAGAAVLATSALTVMPSASAAEVVLSSDFEDSTTQGWFGRGDAVVAVSAEKANGGTTSLLTTGRTATWHGPGIDLRDVLQTGAEYEIEAHVRLTDGADPVTISVQRRPAGGEDQFDTVAWQAPASADDWTRVAGTYTFDTDNHEQLELYIESPNADAGFYLDDVTITMTSPPPGGSQTLIEADFETGTAQGWGPRGPDEVVEPTQAAAHSGEWSLLTSGRTNAWNGPSIDVTDTLEVGETYDFEMRLRLAPGQDPADLRFSIQRDVGGESFFDTIIPGTEVTSDEWIQLTGSYTLADEVDGVSVYAESAEALADFYLDDFVLSVRTPPEVQDITPLKDVLADDFPVGSAIDQREIVGPQAELLTKHFNSITAENHMKPEAIQPEEGQFTFGQADALVEFAEANDMRVYGHTLVWHSQTPSWFWEDENGDPLTSSPEDRQLALDRMQAHIEAIAARYGDRMWAWDVVNEAIDESQVDGLRRSRWYEIIGPEYLNYAFEFARDAFGPDVKLFLNDYNTEFPAKRAAMYDVVERLIAEGAPIDGVGHQLHLNLTRPVSWVDDSITMFKELGVDQVVTELDVSISTSSQESLPQTPPDRLIRQGYYYRDLFEVLRSHSDVLDSVTTWGLYDARSWLRTWPIDRPHEAPLFFDDDLQAKPAYTGVVAPDELPHLPQILNVPGGTPEVDGATELLWDLLPGVNLQEGADGAATGFELRWDDDNLYVLAQVSDATADAADRVDLFVEDANYTVSRDGTTSDGLRAEVTGTTDGYVIEAAVPLLTPGEPGGEVGFDIRITDAATGEQVSWSDQNHEQENDTSRWGALTLVEPVRYVNVPYTLEAPEIDGAVESAWSFASSVTTEVLVEGDADGATADLSLLWDDDRLYVLAEVADPQLDAGNSNAWEHDSVEVFVDPGNTKTGPFKAADGQYRVSFENHQSISGDLDVVGDNLTSAARVVDGGYIVEASIELDDMTPEIGSLIGLELQVNDATDGGRTAVHTWHDPTGQSFQDTSRWGVARLVAPTCDVLVDGAYRGPLTVESGTTCLVDGTDVHGPVQVSAGASLLVDGSEVKGPVSARGAGSVEISDAAINGPVTIAESTGTVRITDTTVIGPVHLRANTTVDAPPVISGNTIRGPLSCRGNQPPPVNSGAANTVNGPQSGQCANL